MPALSIIVRPESTWKERFAITASNLSPRRAQTLGRDTLTRITQASIPFPRAAPDKSSKLVAREPSDSTTGGAIVGSLVGFTVLVLLYLGCCYQWGSRRKSRHDPTAWNHPYNPESLRPIPNQPTSPAGSTVSHVSVEAPVAVPTLRPPRINPQRSELQAPTAPAARITAAPAAAAGPATALVQPAASESAPEVAVVYHTASQPLPPPQVDLTYATHAQTEHQPVPQELPADEVLPARGSGVVIANVAGTRCLVKPKPKLEIRAPPRPRQVRPHLRVEVPNAAAGEFVPPRVKVCSHSFLVLP